MSNRILDGFRAERIVLVQSEWTRFDGDRLKRLSKYRKIGTPASLSLSLSCFHANDETCARKISTRSCVKDSPALTSAVLRSNEPLCGWRFEEYIYAYMYVRILTHGWEHDDKFLMGVAHAYVRPTYLFHIYVFLKMHPDIFLSF